MTRHTRRLCGQPRRLLRGRQVQSPRYVLACFRSKHETAYRSEEGILCQLPKQSFTRRAGLSTGGCAGVCAFQRAAHGGVRDCCGCIFSHAPRSSRGRHARRLQRSKLTFIRFERQRKTRRVGFSLNSDPEHGGEWRANASRSMTPLTAQARTTRLSASRCFKQDRADGGI